jgi:hypothetical protein
MTTQNHRPRAPRRLPVVIASGLVLLAALTFVLVRGGRPSASEPLSTPASPTLAAATSAPPASTVAPPTAKTPSTSSTEPTRSAAPTAGSSTSAAATSTQSRQSNPTVVATKAVPTKSVSLRNKSELGNGVSVRVTKVESVKGKARGPGEIAGPALRVTVRVANETARAVSMSLALVNVYYGTDKTPAPALSGPGVEPLRASIASGRAASGRYVFGVPRGQRDVLQVEFSYTTDAPTVIFSGAA